MHDGETKIQINHYDTKEEYVLLAKRLIVTSSEYQNHKPKPSPYTETKRKKTEISACTINKQIHEIHIDQLSLPQVR